jgi:hypothetical protein
MNEQQRRAAGHLAIQLYATTTLPLPAIAGKTGLSDPECGKILRGAGFCVGDGAASTTVDVQPTAVSSAD